MAESYLDTENRLPEAFHERVHASGGVLYDEKMKAWLVSSPSLIKDVLRDDSTYVQPYASMKAGATYRALRINNPRSFQFLTGTEHRAMHGWWVRDLLSPKWVSQYTQSTVLPVVKRRIEMLRERPTFDLVDDYAEHIPVGVFAALMGLDWQDEAYLVRVKALNDTIASFASLANSLRLEAGASDKQAAIVESAIAAGEELNQMLLPVIRERRQGAGDDFISRLWKGGPTLYADWNEVDTLDACRRLLFAGTDTTTHAIANGFKLLLSDTALRQQLLAGDPQALANFCEEVLRLHGSVHFRIRRAAADVVLGEHRIGKDEMIVLLLIAANQDPARYGCPHQARLDRPAPRDPLSFSYGPRSCPGSNLARAELQAAIDQGLRAFPGMVLNGSIKPPSFEGFLLRSYRPLHVRVAQPAAA